MTAYQGKFQPRRGTAAQWQSNNTVLALGEWGYDSDADRFKIGDGSTAWNSSGWVTNTPLVPPPSTGWSAFNSGSVTDNTESRAITLASGAGDNWKGELRTLSPASNYTATFYIEWAMPSLNYNYAGVILKNSGGSSIVTFGAIYNTTVNAGFQVTSMKWTNATTFNTFYATTAALTGGLPNWLRIRDDTTTRFFEYSHNGVDWVLNFSVGRTDFITPDQIGWGVNANNTGGSYTTIARLRHFVTS